MMKTILTLVAAILFFGLLNSCEEQEGFLLTKDAGYTPDSVVFKAMLNPEIADDAKRIKFQIPWQSQGIQGTDGTPPIEYAISRIDTEVEGVDVKQFSINRGSGVIELPYDHTLTAGAYVISLYVSNIWGRVELPSAIKIIIE